MENVRIVVFTSDLSYDVRRRIVAIDDSIPNLTWLVVVHAQAKSLETSPHLSLYDKAGGARFFPLCMRLFTHSSGVVDPTVPGYRYSFAALQAQNNVCIVEVPDIHEQKTINIVHGFSADLGLCLSAPILNKALFSLPRLGTLNLHEGKLPDFRGGPPAFWELWNDVDEIGCTVHWVEEKVNGGDIVKETIIRRKAHSTLRGLQLTLHEASVKLLISAVEAVLTGDAVAVPQATSGGGQYGIPTLAQQAKLKRKTDALQCIHQPWLKRTAKDIYFALRIGLQKITPNQCQHPKATVLIYHRVSDDIRDFLTVGIEQFDRQMEWLRHHCHVISIERLIAEKTLSHQNKPVVCVTFDDGYLDNYENAVPVLLRHGIPAAFYVSTGIITNDGVFPHDILLNNQKQPLMTWGQLREMHAERFSIGSHTVNHIDCAHEAEDVVRQELADAITDLRRELGLQEVILAYPYGGRQHMTAQRLELVKQAGYRGCLSAYGGVNVAKVDPYNILRTGGHYEFSDMAFRYVCLGLQ